MFCMEPMKFFFFSDPWFTSRKEIFYTVYLTNSFVCTLTYVIFLKKSSESISIWWTFGVKVDAVIRCKILVCFSFPLKIISVVGRYPNDDDADWFVEYEETSERRSERLRVSSIGVHTEKFVNYISLRKGTFCFNTKKS